MFDPQTQPIVDPCRFTFLSLGQQYTTAGEAGFMAVARLTCDPFGMLHVTLRMEDGREVSAFAEQIEAAIAEGQIVPAGPTTPA